MKKLFHENGLAITSFVLFLLFWAAMGIEGFLNYNEQLQDHNEILSFIAGWALLIESWQ